MAKGRARQQEKTNKKKKAETSGRKRIGSDEVMQETFLRHLRAAERIGREEDDLKTRKTKVYELATDEGVTKRSLKFALALKKDEGVEKAKAERDEQMRVATWLGFGKQLEMFAPEEGDKVWEEGSAAMANEPASPPPHLQQKAAQRWMNGGLKPLSDTIASIAEKAGVSLQQPPPPAAESSDEARPL